MRLSVVLPRCLSARSWTQGVRDGNYVWQKRAGVFARESKILVQSNAKMGVGDVLILFYHRLIGYYFSIRFDIFQRWY